VPFTSYPTRLRRAPSPGSIGLGHGSAMDSIVRGEGAPAVPSPQTRSRIGEGSAYRADVDGLRALAVLAVIGFHAFPRRVPGGFVGVDVFFVISGFLITGIILNDLRRDRFSFRKFYARRVRRIFPALIVVLAASLVLGWFLLLP